MKRRVWRGVLLFVSLVLVSTPVVAQVLYGSIVGTVTDSADLAVPGATVTITHAETNQARETTSQRNGELCVPERGRRHLPGRRHVARLPIVPRPGHRRAAERRRPCRRQAQRGHTVGVGAGDRRFRAAPDRNRGGANSDDKPATGESAYQRTQFPERADTDPRSRAAELFPDRRHQQPRARHASVGQWRAQLEHRLPARRCQRDEPVDSEPAGLHAGDRGDRDCERRHEQLRRGAGYGRRCVGERADQERHEHAARVGLRIPDP